MEFLHTTGGGMAAAMLLKSRSAGVLANHKSRCEYDYRLGTARRLRRGQCPRAREAHIYAHLRAHTKDRPKVGPIYAARSPRTHLLIEHGEVTRGIPTSHEAGPFKSEVAMSSDLPKVCPWACLEHCTLTGVGVRYRSARKSKWKSRGGG
jgi:hypothetical protein